MNGDGWTDLAVLRSDTSASSASVEVVFSQVSQSTAPLGHAGGFSIRSPNAFLDVLGADVAALGDVNGDGFDDLAVGAPYADTQLWTNNGAVYVVYGKPDDAAVDLGSPGPAFLTIHGASSENRIGATLASAGDLNGDGRRDLFVGAPYAAQGRGTILGVPVPAAGDVDLASGGAFFTLTNPTTEFSFMGRTLANAGDQNGDGRDDLAFSGSASNSDAESVFVQHTPAAGSTIGLGGALSRGSRFDLGASGTDRPAALRQGMLADAGDQNGDGRHDLAIAGSGTDSLGRRDNGTVFVPFTPPSGSVVSLDAPLGTAGFSVGGPVDDSGTGTVITALADQNGDGRRDLLVVNAYALDPAGTRAQVVFAPGPGAAVDLGGGWEGWSMVRSRSGSADVRGATALGDLDGDGLDEAALAALPWSLAGPDAYAVTTVVSSFEPRGTTGAATNVTDDDATVAPNHPLAPSVARTVDVQYGPSTTYAASSAPQSVSPAGTGSASVTASLAELTPGTTYHYRVRVRTAAGVVAYGQDSTLTTA
ncbi:MAG: FG-GAP-like repeat-containing protein, partial [Actinomycetota bacterium]|nr:FG-GAP-like repeat-containing protein [Actinomycetota bacterium]